MALYLATNSESLMAQNNLQSSQASLANTVQQLSSGMRINSAADDAAGMAIATRMNSQIGGMAVAVQNANNGISLAQTAQSALSSVTTALQSMRDLAVESRNDTNSASDKDSLDQQFGQLADEVQRVLGGTQFNGLNILGANAGTTNFQVGAGTSVDDQIAVTTTNLTTDATITAVAGTDQTGAGRAVIDHTASDAAIGTVINNIDTAITTISTAQSLYGATQNRFTDVVSNLQSASVNATTAQGRIMDVDYASATANLSKENILQQAGTAMLAQANQSGQGVLTLLR
jgi:flagellin